MSRQLQIIGVYVTEGSILCRGFWIVLSFLSLMRGRYQPTVKLQAEHGY